MKKKPTLDITFDHGILEEFKYSNPNKPITIDYLKTLKDDTIEDIETAFWEKQPITFSKWLPILLNNEADINTKEMFCCLDIYIKVGGTKYNYKFRENKLI